MRQDGLQNDDTGAMAIQEMIEGSKGYGWLQLIDTDQVERSSEHPIRAMHTHGHDSWLF